MINVKADECQSRRNQEVISMEKGIWKIEDGALYREGKKVLDESYAEWGLYETDISGLEGNVLVSGLGLGILFDAIRAVPAVERITCVEIDADLISIAWKESMGTIVNMDLLDFIEIKANILDIDSAFIDIWWPSQKNTRAEIIQVRNKLEQHLTSSKVVIWNEQNFLSGKYE